MDAPTQQSWRQVAATNGISGQTYDGRIRLGWTEMQAATIPVQTHSLRSTETLPDGRQVLPVAEDNGISDTTYRRRRVKGWTPTEAATIPPGQPRDPWMRIAISNGISRATYRDRVSQLDWDPEQAATIPAGQKESKYGEWPKVAAANGIKYSTFIMRVKDRGWDPERAATTPTAKIAWTPKRDLEAVLAECQPGLRYGNWAIVRHLGVDRNHRRAVLARCDCGNVATTYIANLTSRRSTRCKECAIKALNHQAPLPPKADPLLRLQLAQQQIDSQSRTKPKPRKPATKAERPPSPGTEPGTRHGSLTVTSWRGWSPGGERVDVECDCGHRFAVRVVKLVAGLAECRHCRQRMAG